MAKNHVYRMGPLDCGVSVDPSFPARNTSATNPASANADGAYRSSTGDKTLESGDLVRMGGVLGVVEVDHNDKLADADGVPVINFNHHVWDLEVTVIPAVTATASTHFPAGTPLYYLEAQNSAAQGRDWTGAKNRFICTPRTPPADGNPDGQAPNGGAFKAGGFTAGRDGDDYVMVGSENSPSGLVLLEPIDTAVAAGGTVTRKVMLIPQQAPATRLRVA